MSISTTNPEGVRETATTTVIVSGVDVDGVSLVAEGPVAVSGTLVTETARLCPPAQSRPRVVADPITPGRRPTQIVEGDDNGMVSSSGAFALQDDAGTRGDPGVVAAGRMGGEERGERRTRSRGQRDRHQGRAGARRRQGRRHQPFPAVTGRITDDKGAMREGIVVLFPADEARWLGIADNVRHARTDQTGLFRLATVPPGDYLAVALETLQPWQAADPEFLATLKDAASRVTVREGQPSQLTLPLLHRRQEVGVRLRLPHLVEQQLHRPRSPTAARAPCAGPRRD